MNAEAQVPEESAEAAGWLASKGWPAVEMHSLSGDVSLRRYARCRLADGTSAILASYPPELFATAERFLQTTELLRGAGVRVPRILAADEQSHRFMLVEDLGPRTVYERGLHSPEEWRSLYRTALAILERIRSLSVAQVHELSPPLDEEVLSRELEQTWQVFFDARGLLTEPALRSDFLACLAEVCARLGAEEAVPCHRDFMVRNLVLEEGFEEGALAVLDHQDLRPGPPAYDLASLLNDSLFPAPEVEAEVLSAALEQGLIPSRESYHRAAVQRTFKAVGTYAAFAARGATRHLPLIAPTVARGLEHLRELPEAGDLPVRLAEALHHDAPTVVR